mmetsp:Transcript_32401/g.76113  ORF Transcript_32401/g.76113 Transcript_32401/m.76113 type:complete len:206 (+) Transcript_32401:523-1140(+)
MALFFPTACSSRRIASAPSKSPPSASAVAAQCRHVEAKMGMCAMLFANPLHNRSECLNCPLRSAAPSKAALACSTDRVHAAGKRFPEELRCVNVSKISMPSATRHSRQSARTTADIASGSCAIAGELAAFKRECCSVLLVDERTAALLPLTSSVICRTDETRLAKSAPLNSVRRCPTACNMSTRRSASVHRSLVNAHRTAAISSG